MTKPNEMIMPDLEDLKRTFRQHRFLPKLQWDHDETPAPEVGTIHINSSKNLDGSSSVSRFDGPDIGWTPIGSLQPEPENVPKTQAQHIREAYGNAKAEHIPEGEALQANLNLYQKQLHESEDRARDLRILIKHITGELENLVVQWRKRAGAVRCKHVVREEEV